MTGTTRPRLVVATHSAHKLRELRELLQLEHGELVSLDDLGVTGDPVEDGADLRRPTRRSRPASACAPTGLPTLADDSGLEVDALDGGPGVRTRRYAGETATDADNNAQAAAPRSTACRPSAAARATCACSPWRCPGGRPARRAAADASPAGPAAGRIATAPRGTGGFGYDPIFEPASRAARRADARPVDARPRRTRSRIGRARRGGWRRTLAALGF